MLCVVVGAARRVGVNDPRPVFFALQQLAGFTKLERLYLDNVSSITDSGAKTVGTPTSLKVLRLTRSKITDTGMEELKNLKHRSTSPTPPTPMPPWSTSKPWTNFAG
jgi:hypothetical protein